MSQPRTTVCSVLLCAMLTGTGLAGAGCSTRPTPFGHRTIPIVEPAGPGSVFSTIDEAAVAGLAYAYRESDLVDRHQWARGGTVYQVGHGYSYRAVRVARREDPDRVQISLRDHDVAHFATYPKGTHQEDRLNESHSAHDRRNVDELDPRHRPAFILTPSLQVKGYGGAHSDFITTIVSENSDVATTH